MKNPDLLKNMLFKSLTILDDFSRKGYIHGSLRPSNILFTEKTIRFCDQSKSHEFKQNEVYAYDDE